MFAGRGEAGSGFPAQSRPLRLRTRTKSRRTQGEKEFSFLAREQKGKMATALWLDQGQSEEGLLRAGGAGGGAGESALPGRWREMLPMGGGLTVRINNKGTYM